MPGHLPRPRIGPSFCVFAGGGVGDGTNGGNTTLGSRRRPLRSMDTAWCSHGPARDQANATAVAVDEQPEAVVFYLVKPLRC
jgi:hypothetical protein